MLLLACRVTCLWSLPVSPKSKILLRRWVSPTRMTTMAALMGTLPIALGWGAGAEARRPLGLAVVGGLLVSQTLTLYVTPVFYIYMERLQERFARRKKAAEPVHTRLEPQRLEPQRSEH